MAKSKAVKVSKPSRDEPKAITSVKGSSVIKPSQTPKSKSQDVAKSVAAKAGKAGKAGKKAVKEPTPESSSEESDEEVAAGAETSDSSDSSDGSDAEAAAPKTNGVAKTNGKTNGAVTKKAVESDSESDSDEEDSDSEEEAKPATNGAKVVASEDDSDDSEEDESDEEPKPKAANGVTNGVSKAVKKDAGSSDEDSDDSEGESDSDDSDDSEGSEEEAAPSNKRKAETEATPVAKKVKSEVSSNVPANASKNLFVGSLSWNIDEDWLTREFESFGTLAGVRIITDRESGRSKGFGYVEFETIEDAVKAHNEMKGTSIDNREINVDYSKPRTEGDTPRGKDRAKSFGDEISEPTDTLFVGNIAFEATSEMIGEAFGEHGNVAGVRLPTDMETGQPKGFGYVQFNSVDEAKAALEAMNGADIGGRALRLDFSRPRPSNDSPGGRGGRGGGRGRGGDRGGGFRGGRGGGDRGGRGGFGGRGRGGDRGGRGGTTNRGGFGDFKGKKMTF